MEQLEKLYQNNIQWAREKDVPQILQLSQQVEQYREKVNCKLTKDNLVRQYSLDGVYKPPYKHSNPVKAHIGGLMNQIDDIRVNHFNRIRTAQALSEAPKSPIGKMECVNRYQVRRKLQGGEYSRVRKHLVACGKCQACQQQQRLELVNRAQAEMMGAKANSVYFLHITYAQHHAIIDEVGNHIVDHYRLKKFLEALKRANKKYIKAPKGEKEFKRSLLDPSYHKKHLRYLSVVEYSCVNRAHHHILLYNLADELATIDQIRKIWGSNCRMEIDKVPRTALNPYKAKAEEVQRQTNSIFYIVNYTGKDGKFSFPTFPMPQGQLAQWEIDNVQERHRRNPNHHIWEKRWYKLPTPINKSNRFGWAIAYRNTERLLETKDKMTPEGYPIPQSMVRSILTKKYGYDSEEYERSLDQINRKIKKLVTAKKQKEVKRLSKYHSIPEYQYDKVMRLRDRESLRRADKAKINRDLNKVKEKHLMEYLNEVRKAGGEDPLSSIILSEPTMEGSQAQRSPRNIVEKITEWKLSQTQKQGKTYQAAKQERQKNAKKRN